MVIKIDPESYYDENTLRVMGLDEELLEEARREGRLRFRVLGAIVMYRGQWVLDWLDQVEPVAAGGPR